MPDIAIADADRPDGDKVAELQREIAALRRQLADCAAERDEALEQQSAAAGVSRAAEHSLRATEERHTLVIQAVAEGVYEWDIERNSLWPSPRLIEIFGFAGRQLGAGDWNELVHPDDFPRYRDALRDCFKGIAPRLDCEYRVRHSDGDYRWIEDRAVPVRNAAGRAVRLVGAVTDITGRKHAEQALRETNRAKDSLLNDLNAVVDTIDYGVLFMGPDLRARVVNRAFRRMWGIPDEFIATGPDMADLVNYNRHTGIYPVPESEFDAYVARRAKAIRQGDITPVEMHRADGVVLRYGGVVLPDGGRLLTYFDITEAKHREAELREALEQQTATAEVLQVINSSPGDLAPVFDAMLAKAMRLCDARFGQLVTSADGEVFTIAAAQGPPAIVEFLRNRPPTRPSSGTSMERLVRGERCVHVHDAIAEEAYRRGDPTRRALVDLGGCRTLLSVGLRKDDALLGAITVYRSEVKPFSTNEIALIENFAAQAVIAMENARLINETREALEQQTATAEVLQVISGSTTDVQPVFDTIVASAAKLCVAEFTAVARLDGNLLHLVATNNLSPQEANAFHALFPRAPGRHFVMGRAFVDGRATQIADVLTDPEYDQRTREILQTATGYRTFLGIPILRDGVPIGVIGCARRQVKPFTAAQVKLIETFADQAGIAIENARLFDETREALEQQTATAEVLQVINSSPGDLAPVFDAMLEKAMHLCEANFGNLAIFDGECFNFVAAHGPAQFDEWIRQSGPARPGPGTTMERMLNGEHVIHIADIADDDAYRSGHPVRRALVDVGGFHSFLGIALRKGDALLGGLHIYRQEVRPFSEKQIALLQNFAAQAVIAMENARLLNEIRQRQAELRVTFDNMADGVAMFDRELRLTAWNRNFQHILDLPDAVLGERPAYADYLRTLAERGEFGGEDLEAELSRRLDALDRELRLERTRPDGRVIEVRRNAMPDGGFVLIYSDITERKRSEAEIRAARDAAEAAYRDLKAAQASLIQAEKMASLGQLTAGIAHEIKNPLNFVNNFAGLSVELLDELKEAAAPAIDALDAEARSEIGETIDLLTGNLEKIAEHGRRADGIVRSMLEHSRGGSGERRAVDLNALIDEALNLAYHGSRAQDPSFNITLERDFAAAIAPIDLVPQDITRVCLNLFGNGFYAACKREKEGSEAGFKPILRVATRDLGDAVEIRVRDNGTGIPDAVRARLFQPFFTTKPTGEGTGLGLSISYDIVTQQHGGAITVNSRVGEFTEFAVRLPRGMAGAIAAS